LRHLCRGGVKEVYIGESDLGLQEVPRKNEDPYNEDNVQYQGNHNVLPIGQLGVGCCRAL
jgi:hypothetical protein